MVEINNSYVCIANYFRDYKLKRFVLYGNLYTFVT